MKRGGKRPLPLGGRNLCYLIKHERKERLPYKRKGGGNPFHLREKKSKFRGTRVLYCAREGGENRHTFRKRKWGR